MIPRRSSSVPKEDDSPRLLCCYQRCSESCHWRSQVLPSAPKVLSGTPRCSQTCHDHFYGTRVPVIRYLSFSEGQPECPLRVWYSPEIDASKFALHILSDTPGGFQWIKYILLMGICKPIYLLGGTPCGTPQSMEGWDLSMRCLRD